MTHVSDPPVVARPSALHVARADGLDVLGADYRDLFARSQATLFQHPTWLHHLYRDLAPEVGAVPLIVTIRADDRLVGVLPLVRRGRVVRRIEPADLGVSDYAAPVLDRDAAPALLTDPDLHRSIRRALGRADLLRFDKIHRDAGEVAALLGAGQVVRHGFDSHAIALSGTFADWRSSLQHDVVRHLDRKRKRVGGAGRVLGLREIRDPGEIDEAFDRMRDFRRARFAERRAVDLTQDPRYDAFYRAVARRCAVDGGPGHTVILTVNDEIVGVSFGLADSERELFLLIGYDYERYRNYSLGLLMVEELIGVSAAQGRGIYDLTIGHDGYKADFGARPTPMYSARRRLTALGWAAQVGADRHTAARRLAKAALARRTKG